MSDRYDYVPNRAAPCSRVKHGVTEIFDLPTTPKLPSKQISTYMYVLVYFGHPRT